jgi:AcrR family transcriptional regulator
LARKPADQSVNRDDILIAAANVLHRNGYEATTMKDIAAEVNLTAASLYHYFRNKDALLLAVLETGLTHVIEQLEPIVSSGQRPADKLRDLIQVHVTNITDNTAVGAAMVFEIRSLMSMNSSLAELLERRNTFFAQRDHFETLFRQVIQEGVDAGDFVAVDVPIFVKTMLGAQNWVAVWYRPGGRLDGEAISNRMADTFLTSLLAR